MAHGVVGEWRGQSSRKLNISARECKSVVEVWARSFVCRSVGEIPVINSSASDSENF